ncbi:MAG: GNAT family N-acetyltransferase [Alphaproteobacteria bacterium]|nr:GNAT family N-acetyltransferase [Alphaproteobacteria bacterium]
MLIVKNPEPDDRDEWQELWIENCAHFGATDMSLTVIDALWRRIIDPASVMQAWLARTESGSKSLGLAHTILHPHTFSLRMVCYLEDLWVSPDARGAGVGSYLIKYLTEVAKQQGWRRLYWETGIDNEPAQRLYDRVATRRASITYQVDTTR